eukprot:77252-Prymnesium_polylepis.1
MSIYIYSRFGTWLTHSRCSSARPHLRLSSAHPPSPAASPASRGRRIVGAHVGRCSASPAK